MRTGSPLPPISNCLICGVGFLPKTTKGKATCSDECQRAYARKYVSENRERYREHHKRFSQTPERREYQRKWMLQNRDRMKQWHTAHREANRERYRESVRRRRYHTRKKIDPRLIELKVSMYGGKCWICQAAPYRHLDHVKPISQGGQHILSNLRPACAKCNRAKASLWPWPQVLSMVNSVRQQESTLEVI
ncbi:HNH endonuclease [Tsukamurella paurometabola]